MPHLETHVSEGLLTREELYHQEDIGCIKAQKSYDPSKGRFVQYAFKFIKGEMIFLLRMKGALIHVPHKKYQEMTYLHNEREKDRLEEFSTMIETAAADDFWGDAVLTNGGGRFKGCL